MTSLKQIEANRRNALKSTGPITQEGKERSRCNAIRHGLTAETVISSLENGEDYHAFEAAVTADYDADSAVQRELVLRLASVLWRLRRSTAIESALFEAMAGDRPLTPSPAVGKMIAISTRRANDTSSGPIYSADCAIEEFVCTPQDLAKAFVRLTAPPRSRSIVSAATSTSSGGKHGSLSRLSTPQGEGTCSVEPILRCIARRRRCHTSGRTER